MYQSIQISIWMRQAYFAQRKNGIKEENAIVDDGTPSSKDYLLLEYTR